MKIPLLACWLALLAFAASAWAARPPLPPMEGEVIVKFKAGGGVMRAHALAVRADAASVRATLDGRAASLGARVGRSLAAGAAVSDRIQVVRATGISAAELAAQLARDPEVEFAVPNERVRRLAGGAAEPLFLAGPAANDALRTGGPAVGQWYLRTPTSGVVSSINAEAAWLTTAGSAGVVVAVLDTGVRPDHPEFSGQPVLGYDFISDVAHANDGDGRDADPADPGDWISTSEAGVGAFRDCFAENSSWHGTATSSLVGAAANGVGMSGVAPGITLLHLRVLGKCGGSSADIWAAMRWAVGIDVPGVPRNTHPAKVLNLSFGSEGTACSASYQAAVDEVLAAGAVVVVAAGNSDGGPVDSPGNCNGAIAVAAVRHLGSKVGFSSIGPEVAISAPGGNCVNVSGGACLYPVLAASNTGTQGPAGPRWFDSYKYEYGTSFSAPLVAGVAALMYSVQPNLTPAQVRTRLMGSARPFPTSGGTAGIGQCQAPSSTQPQDECYCTTSTCGAGMLDAAAAVAGLTVAGPTARIAVTPAAPTAGGTITLDASGSTPSGSNAITQYEWRLTEGGGTVIGGTANNTVFATSRSVTLTATTAGSFTVSLLVTDGLQNSGLATQTVTVAAAPGTTPPTSGGGGGGGGGAFALPWLGLLALAVAALLRTARRRA